MLPDDLYAEMSRAEEQLKITEQELHRRARKGQGSWCILASAGSAEAGVTVGLAAPIEDG